MRGLEFFLTCHEVLHFKWRQSRKSPVQSSSLFSKGKQFKKVEYVCKHGNLPFNIEILGMIFIFFPPFPDKWNVIRASTASFSGGRRLDFDVS